MLRRVPFFDGASQMYEHTDFPEVEAFRKSGPLRSPKASWQTQQLRPREAVVDLERGTRQQAVGASAAGASDAEDPMARFNC